MMYSTKQQNRLANVLQNCTTSIQFLHKRGNTKSYFVVVSHKISDVNKTTRFKTKTKTKTVGPITTYSLPTVNEIIFYSTIFYNLCTLSTS